MNLKAGPDSVSRPARLLVSGRAIGFAATFAIGIILARIFSPAEFGTYKQFFLVFATLFGLAQLGMAESLYYFVPRNPERTGRYVCNALITLAAAGIVCTSMLVVWRTPIAVGLSNPPLADDMLLLGSFLTLMLMSAVLEIVMVSRKRHGAAAATYAASDIGRTLLLIVPALLLRNVHAAFVGATVFAAARLALLLASLWREFGSELRIDIPLWREQLAYALPFALAVGVEVVQTNFHQYVVASRFDAATFAIYAVGCLQIPLVDLIVSSTVNVLMVKMAEDTSDRSASLALFHQTVYRLAFLIFPLAVLLVVVARNLIVALFTTTYLASVPIFVVWSLTMLPAVFAVDAVLRAHAQTRFLLVTNLIRLALVAALIGPFLSWFGLGGAVLITLLATSLVKGLGLVRIARLMHVSVFAVAPWAGLRDVALRATVAAAPPVWLAHAVAMPPLTGLIVGTVTYGAAYAALSYGPWVIERLIAPLPFTVRRRLTD